MKYEMKYGLSFLESDLRELLKKLKKHNTYAIQLENEIILYKLENDNLKSIIKEVREYIEGDIKGNYFKRYDDEVYKMCEDLLDILKGVDKE